MHEPLSKKLAQIIDANATGEGVTLNELLERTEGRGFYLIIIILSLPFIVPLSIPGVSTVLGLAITLLSLRLAFGRSARLPRFMGERRLTPALQRNLLTGGVKFLRFVEKLSKPRKTAWMSTGVARFANALFIALMGFLLALPFPPFPPLTNTLPCYAIILLAVSMMEEDGVTIWIAYAFAIGTSIYLFLIVEVLETVLVKVWHSLQHWLER